MYKKLFWASVILWVIVGGVFLKFFISGHTKVISDKRRAVILSVNEREIVLGEMRILLLSLNEILKALGKNDFKEVRLAANRAGANMAQDINPILMGKLPLDFKTLGMSLHQDFDQLSIEVSRGMTKDQILVRLGQMTNKCIACHASFKLEAH